MRVWIVVMFLLGIDVSQASAMDAVRAQTRTNQAETQSGADGFNRGLLTAID
jgi:hypothetical protein